MSLTKGVEDCLFTKGHRTLPREMKDSLRYWRQVACSQIGRWPGSCCYSIIYPPELQQAFLSRQDDSEVWNAGDLDLST